MNSRDEDWVLAAMTDDALVVNLLIRLHNSTPPSPPHESKTAALHLEWTLRQRRSKPVSLATHSKKAGAARASPTTPLSWSGATSFSGGCGEGGVEESSRPSLLSHCTRSKANVDREKITSKRSRKKKTLTELKEEESRLVKERRQLKRDLAALHLNLENQRARSESLKRVKIELQPHPLRNKGQNWDTRGMNACELEQNTTAFRSICPTPTVPPVIVARHPTTKHEDDAALCPKVVLPDLNMPFEEEHSLEVACDFS